MRVRGQQWVVSALRPSRQPVDELSASILPGRTMVSLTSISDDDLGDELTLVWEIEPGRQILPPTELLGAFLDAVRWGTVASAGTRTLKAPFRSGISIKDYRLVRWPRPRTCPRPTFSLPMTPALGKTIEAGLIAQELILRHDPGPLLHRLQRAGEAPAGTPDQLEPGTRPLPSLRSGDPADRRLA